MALVEDSYGASGPPLKVRLGLRKAGAVEHLREAKLKGPVDRADRVRSGSMLVLCAWALFMVAGALFAKLSEHWEAATPRASQVLPGVAYDAVQWAGFVGTAIVAIGAVAAVPAVIRLVRHGDFAPVRAPLRRAMLGVTIAGAATAGIVVWAHHLSVTNRNGGDGLYTVAGTTWALLVCATIGLCTAAVIAAASRIELSNRMWRLYQVLAIGLTLSMAVVAIASIAWWLAVASAAPGFVDTRLLALPAAPITPALVLASLIMVVGLATAVLGVDRIVRTTDAPAW